MTRLSRDHGMLYSNSKFSCGGLKCSFCAYMYFAGETDFWGFVFLIVAETQRYFLFLRRRLICENDAATSRWTAYFSRRRRRFLSSRNSHCPCRIR